MQKVVHSVTTAMSGYLIDMYIMLAKFTCACVYRRSATGGHRSSEGGLLWHSSAPDALELQSKVEQLEAEIAMLQQRLQSASHDRTAELEHVQQMNRALKAELAALQAGLPGSPPAKSPAPPSRPPMPSHPAIRHNINLESCGSCLLLDAPPEALHHDEDDDDAITEIAAQQLPYHVHRLAPIMEVEGLSNRTTTAEEVDRLVPGLQSQVHALATSLQVKTNEAEALQQMVEHLEKKVTTTPQHATPQHVLNTCG